MKLSAFVSRIPIRRGPQEFHCRILLWQNSNQKIQRIKVKWDRGSRYVPLGFVFVRTRRRGNFLKNSWRIKSNWYFRKNFTSLWHSEYTGHCRSAPRNYFEHLWECSRKQYFPWIFSLEAEFSHCITWLRSVPPL